MYILDADVFITAARTYYAFDLETKFWERLIELSDNNEIFSIDKVKTELLRGNDDLATWAKEDFHSAFVSTDDDEVIKNYSEIMIWVYNNDQFSDDAKADFARGADGWIIAYAKAKKIDVVTLEKFNSEIRRKVPIPNICKQFSVKSMDTFAMLRSLGVQLSD